MTFTKITWHLLYLGALSTVGIWYWQQHNAHQHHLVTEAGLNRLLVQEFQKMAAWNSSGLQKAEKDHPNSIAKPLCTTGMRLYRFTQDWWKAGAQFNRLAMRQDDYLQGSARLLDSLRQTVASDSVVAAVYQHTWPRLSTDEWEPFLSPSNTGPEREALLLHGALQAQTALYAALEQLNRRLAYEQYAPERFVVLPFLEPDTTPHAGQPCVLRFYGAPVRNGFQWEESLVDFVVNGRKYPATQGVADIQQVFKRPGKDSLQVEAHLQWPSDATSVQTLRRTFTINVIPL